MHPFRIRGLCLALSFLCPAAFAEPAFEFGGDSLPKDGAVVVFASSDGALEGIAAQIDAMADGALSAAMEAADLQGVFGEGIPLIGVGPYSHITLLYTGDGPLTRRQLADLGGHAAMLADDEADLTIVVDALNADVDGAAAYVAMGYALGDYSYTVYKTQLDMEPDGTIHMFGASDAAGSLYNKDLAFLVDGVALARDLGNAPGNAVYPESFVDTVLGALGEMDNVTVKVLEPDALNELGMGALLGVGQGSARAPRLLVVSYMGAGRSDPPVALVGKGVTFDTGGISLKSGDRVWRMKADMSGAGAVAGAVLAAAGRQEDINVVGIMPLAENMPDANAIRPGDVLTTMSGKTIEIIDTDAEGRLILSDAVWYAQQEFKPRMMVTIATLTGAAIAATGREYAPVISRDFELSRRMMEIGAEAGEDVWPLPLHPNHFTLIESMIADIKNMGGSPGASTGAAVIGTFVDEALPWVHIDMAGMFFADEPRPTYPQGHAGWGVRFMDELLRVESD